MVTNMLGANVRTFACQRAMTALNAVQRAAMFMSIASQSRGASALRGGSAIEMMACSM